MRKGGKLAPVTMQGEQKLLGRGFEDTANILFGGTGVTPGLSYDVGALAN